MVLSVDNIVAGHEQDLAWMEQCMILAKQAQEVGEVPVGAVVVVDNKMVAQGFNQPIGHHDPTAHAEIIAMRRAAQILQNYRLCDATLYVTLEPCAMCAGAIVHARIGRLVFGAYDPKAGAVGSTMNLLASDHVNHRVVHQGGLLAQQCGQLLVDFFKQRR